MTYRDRFRRADCLQRRPDCRWPRRSLRLQNRSTAGPPGLAPPCKPGLVARVRGPPRAPLNDRKVLPKAPPKTLESLGRDPCRPDLTVNHGIGTKHDAGAPRH